MNYIHKEGRVLLSILLISIAIISFLVWKNAANYVWIPMFLGSILLLMIGQFFRNPTRTIEVSDDNIVYAPCDGKVVVIEKTIETEFLKDQRIQLSIFMSPINVHVNRNPIGGVVAYFKYHPGKYLVAWHPKSSTENERTTVVIQKGQKSVLFRQIAGAVARRIKWYISEGQTVQQGDEMGFIKFGSRVDVFLPLDAEINVQMNEVVTGNRTILARI
jgi:phosphatidylserine decarboxylase